MSKISDFDSLYLEPQPFPYFDYKIVGDVAEIEKVRLEPGVINISEWDIKSTLSKETVNYVSTGYGCGDNAINNALKEATDNLSVDINQIAKLIIQLWHPRVGFSIDKISQLTEYVRNLPSSIDDCWGIALNSNNDDVKITLIASTLTRTACEQYNIPSHNNTDWKHVINSLTEHFHQCNCCDDDY